MLMHMTSTVIDHRSLVDASACAAVRGDMIDWELARGVKGTLILTEHGWCPTPTMATSEFGLTALALQEGSTYTIALTSLMVGLIFADFLNVGEFTPDEIASVEYPVTSFVNLKGQIIATWALARMLQDPVATSSPPEGSYAPTEVFESLPLSFDYSKTLEELFDDPVTNERDATPRLVDCNTSSIQSWFLALYDQALRAGRTTHHECPTPYSAADVIQIQKWCCDPTHIARVYADMTQANALHSRSTLRVNIWSGAAKCLWLSQAFMGGNNDEMFRSWWDTHIQDFHDKDNIAADGLSHLANDIYDLLAFAVEGDLRLRASAATLYKAIWHNPGAYRPDNELSQMLQNVWGSHQTRSISMARSSPTLWNDIPTLFTALENAFGVGLCDLPGAEGNVALYRRLATGHK